MKTLCEVAVSEFLPALRALITKELVGTYGMTQKEIAKRMHITQPAVSYYARELRGNKVRILEKSESIMTMVKELSSSLANGNSKPIEVHDLCERLMREKLVDDSLHMCKFCREKEQATA